MTNAERQTVDVSATRDGAALPSDITLLPPANRNCPARYTFLIVVPTLDAGAADTHACELAGLLGRNGHRAIIVAEGGKLTERIQAAGGEFVPMSVASKNPVTMLRCALRLRRLIRQQNCALVHALGRAPGWSAWLATRLTRRPFVTTWFKGFRNQNRFKHFYNGVMARGDRIVVASNDLAALVCDRYGVARDRLAVVPMGVDSARFDPATVSAERRTAMRQAWGIEPSCAIVLVAGRMLRRKGHHVVVRAAARLKKAGAPPFKCVFIGEDQGRTRYTGELWDLITATRTSDVVRFVDAAGDLPAALAVADAVVTASLQPEGMQRIVLEAQAMAVPVIVSEFSAGADVVRAAPEVSDDRATGMRYPAGDDAALAEALLRLLRSPEAERRAIGLRGRRWVTGQFDQAAVAGPLLALYESLAAGPDAARSAAPSL